MKNTDFPYKVFEDINMSEFKKYNKKNVTEDFVSENFKDMGWKTYRPFNDTGIDLIVAKTVCKNGHTQINEIINNNICNICQDLLIPVIRFIQIKTREVKGKQKNVFGYTLQSKDFRTDPRHVFLFYSDYTNDFLIIPIYDYMKIFYDNIETIGKSHFGTPAFRVGNNKLNSLQLVNGKWVWGRKSIDFEQFRNMEGLKRISNCKYDIEIDFYIKEITKMRFELFYRYSAGLGILNEDAIKDIITSMINVKPKEMVQRRKKAAMKIQTTYPSLIQSRNEGYHIRYGLSSDE